MAFLLALLITSLILTGCTLGLSHDPYGQLSSDEAYCPQHRQAPACADWRERHWQ